MKIAIVFPDTLPVPAVKGGAVQTGVQQIIEENEKIGNMDLTVYSIYDAEAEKESRKFTKTKFKFIKKNNRYQTSFIRFVNKVLKKINIGKKFDHTPMYNKKLTSDIKKSKYDYVLVKNAIRFVIPISKVTQGKLYLQLHNDYLNENILAAKKIYNSCHKILVNSNYIKQRVLTINSSKEEDVLVQKNCTDTQMFNKNLYSNDDVINLKTKFNISIDEKVILYSGRIVQEKGIEQLIMAVKQLPSETKYKLLIVGNIGFGQEIENNYLAYLKNISSDISHKVIFTGFVPYKELPKIHAISDIVVVPSIWEEPAGRVVIEASSSGLPVIVSDSGGISDYVSAESGIVVKRGENFIQDLNKEILKLLEDKTLREEMGRAGHKFAQNYNPKTYYLGLIKLISQDASNTRNV